MKIVVGTDDIHFIPTKEHETECEYYTNTKERCKLGCQCCIKNDYVCHNFNPTMHYRIKSMVKEYNEIYKKNVKLSVENKELEHYRDALHETDKKVYKLYKLMAEYPDLPVVSMVRSTITMAGSTVTIEDIREEPVRDVEVTSIYRGKGRIHTIDDDKTDTLYDMRDCEYGKTIDGKPVDDLTDKEFMELYQSLPWEKVIIIWINEKVIEYNSESKEEWNK